MVTVTLGGSLGAHVGRPVWELFVSSVGEAVRAIEAQTKKLYSYLRDKEKEGIEYRVIVNGKDHEELGDLVINREIHSIEIVPVAAGSANGGLWQTILGVVLIIVGVIAVFYGDVGGTIVQLGVGLITAGIAMTLGGVAQMLAKSPSFSANPNLNRSFNADDEKGKEENPGKKQSSYIFSGAANTTRQGQCVPFGYGRLIVGSQLVSFGFTRAKITYAYGDVATPADSDPIFESPFWDVYANDPRAAYVQEYTQIRRYKGDMLRMVADMFDLRDAHPKATAAAMRSYLFRVSRLFVNPRMLTGKDVRLLYTWLQLTELNSIPARQRRFINYVVALTHHYLPGTTVP